MKNKYNKNNIKIYGHVDNPFEKFNKDIDLFCLTSRFDGTPNVLGEAISFKIPCVAPKSVGNVNELLGNGKFGNIYKPGDEKNFIAVELVLIGLSLTWIASSIAGLYHFGIEMNFWTGPDGCSSSIDFSKDTLKYLLNKSPIKCDEVMFSIFGLSLAGWNALMSFIMFMIVSVFLTNKRFIKV